VALADLALGLAVVSALIAAVSLGLGALDRARIARALDDVARLRQAVRTWAELGRTSYDGLSAEALVAAGVLPRAALTTPWGGAVRLAPRSRTSYWITLSGLPEGAARAVLGAYQGRALEAAMPSPGTVSLAFE
jgi:hypothetical protein